MADDDVCGDGLESGFRLADAGQTLPEYGAVLADPTFDGCPDVDKPLGCWSSSAEYGMF